MRKVIRRHIRERSGGVDVAADINAVIAVNDGTSRTEAVQSTSIVQGTSARAGDDEPPSAAPKDDSPQEER